MRISEILKPACVKVPLKGADKQAALFELVDVLSGHGEIPDADQLKQAVWQRETIRTTGIGHGIAVPHGKTEGLTQLNMAIGLTQEPLEFGAIDGKPVELIILLASPIDQTGPHVQALAKISRLLIDDTFRDAIKQAESPEKLYMMLVEHEAATAGV
ncbi:MAG: PTS sugar transporter subunit IIA [Planctomycetota bacterium]